MARTAEEVERLKAQWRQDPAVWDIETTEGFEDHQDELLAYRKQMEEQWAEQRTRYPEWEFVAKRPFELIERLPVIGGWLMRSVHQDPESHTSAMNMAFLLDPNHEWSVGNVDDYRDNRPTQRNNE